MTKGNAVAPVRGIISNRQLVRIGWKDEGDAGPVIGFFSDGTSGRLGDLEDLGGGIQGYPWYSRAYAGKLARDHNVPFEEL